jgi:hypothetical protein
MMGHGFGRTSQQKAVDAFSPVRANDDQLGRPVFGAVENNLARVTLLQNIGGLEPGRTKLFRGPSKIFLGLFSESLARIYEVW